MSKHPSEVVCRIHLCDCKYLRVFLPFCSHPPLFPARNQASLLHTWQGSRVRPSLSRVRLSKIPGRTGASSHSRKEKKYPRLRNSVVQQKTPPLGLYRGLNQSEIVKGGPPLWLAVVQIFLYVCVRRWQMRHVCCCSQTERKRWVVEMRAVLPT